MRQSSNCFFAQALSKDQSKASLVDTQESISTIEQLASAIFSDIINYLIECAICELSLNMKKIEDENQSLKEYMQRSLDCSIIHQAFDIVKKTFSLSRTIALTSR